MMQDKAIRTFGGWSICVLIGLAAACAGGDTPTRSDELVNEIAVKFAGGQVAAAAGAGGSGTGTGGSGGAPASSGTGGSDVVGMGGSAVAGSGSTAEPPAGGSGGSGSGSDTCDGFAILKTSCSGGSCHGAETASGLTNFAFDEDTAKALVGEKSLNSTCQDTSPVFDPDNPAASLVVKKLTNSATNCGGRMPLGASMQIPQADLDCIEDWISGL